MCIRDSTWFILQCTKVFIFRRGFRQAYMHYTLFNRRIRIGLPPAVGTFTWLPILSIVSDSYAPPQRFYLSKRHNWLIRYHRVEISEYGPHLCHSKRVHCCWSSPNKSTRSRPWNSGHVHYTCNVSLGKQCLRNCSRLLSKTCHPQPTH